MLNRLQGRSGLGEARVSVLQETLPTPQHHHQSNILMNVTKTSNSHRTWNSFHWEKKRKRSNII